MYIGIDIGGTFTDIVCLTDEGSVLTRKVSSTSDDYSRAIIQSLPQILKEHSIQPDSVREIIHGTTVATNAILQQTGARTGLITTRGFRDVLELRRIRMPELYNWNWDKPPDLIERANRREVEERLDARGKVLTPLQRHEVETILDELVSSGIESLAVALINSYINPVHEEAIAEIARQRYPDLPCCTSTQLLREAKEYERTATVAVNAYVLPLVRGYLSSLQNSLARVGFKAPLLIMQSNGGSLTAESCEARPVYIIESGPAAGVIAAQTVALKTGVQNAISFDMGGTTAKASIIEGGKLNLASEYEVGSSISLVSRLIKGGGHLIRIPAIDIAEVGAGGGSIARIDHGGALQVGPNSAGASPGPVAYDQGGSLVTITDANLLLGYINPAGLAGGTIRLNTRKAELALASQIADPLSMELLDAAWGVHQIANSNMMRAIRAVSTERGRDVRDYVLIAFGGSGPLHAAGIAQSLGMKEVIIPPFPGLFSGFGLLFADVQHDQVQTYYRPLCHVNLTDLNQTLDSMRDELTHLLRSEGYTDDRILIERYAELRYVGQCFELSVPLPPGAITEEALKQVQSDYDQEYEKTYGYGTDREAETVDYAFVSLKLRGKGLRQVIPKKQPKGTGCNGSRRHAYFGSEYGRVEVPVVFRQELSQMPRSGPLIVDEYDSSAVVPPGAEAYTDADGNLHIRSH